MKRPWIIVLVVIMGGLGVYLYSNHMAAEADPIDDFSNWPPSMTTIKAQIAGMTKLNNEEADRKARELKFAKLFTKRFRDHDPSVPVMLRFDGPHHAKLFCPGRMETWDVDRLAMSAWREARTNLGSYYDLTLFRTFISPGRVKIGELHTVYNSVPKASISYLADPMAPYRRKPSQINQSYQESDRAAFGMHPGQTHVLRQLTGNGPTPQRGAFQQNEANQGSH